MPNLESRFHFACAPVSWGVQDYADESWEQPYEVILDEMVTGGYAGTELGPYGYFPTDPALLRPVLEQKKLAMLSSFVPVTLGDESATQSVSEQIRQVGSLLAALGAPFIVMADAQSPERERIAGRVPVDGSHALTAAEWRSVAQVVAEAERVATGFGLDLVFHPHVATHVETPAETERFFDAISATRVGLCLDTGHCYYGGGDPVEQANKYRHLLRYVHIKDIHRDVLDRCNRDELNFNEAVEAGVFSQIGEGCLDFPAFFSKLDELEFSGWFVVEQDVKYGATTVPPARSMAASLDYLRGVVARLDGRVPAASQR